MLLSLEHVYNLFMFKYKTLQLCTVHSKYKTVQHMSKRDYRCPGLYLGGVKHCPLVYYVLLEVRYFVCHRLAIRLYHTPIPKSISQFTSPLVILPTTLVGWYLGMTRI